MNKLSFKRAKLLVWVTGRDLNLGLIYFKKWIKRRRKRAHHQCLASHFGFELMRKRARMGEPRTCHI